MDKAFHQKNHYKKVHFFVMVFHCYILIYCKLLIYFQTKYYLFLLFSITDASLYIQTQYFCPLSYHKTSASATRTSFFS